MTANVLEFRRARAFADAVDAREARFDEEPGESEGQYDHMLAMVSALATVDGPSLSPQVRLEQRALLVAEFERAYAGGGGAATVPVQRSRRGSHRAARPAVPWPSTRWGRRLAVGGLASMMALGTLGGVAMASTHSLPGDTLYGMKRGLEDWRFNLAGTDEERGKLLLDEASTRMDEARRLMGRGDVGPHGLSHHALSAQTIADVDRALTDMNVEGKRGRDLLNEIYKRSHSLAPLRQLAGFAAVQSQAMDQLEPQLPDQLDPVATQVRGLLSGIRQEVSPLLPATPGGGSASTPDSGDDASPSTSAGNVSTPSGATTSGTGTMRGSSPSAAPSGQTTSGTGTLVGGTGLGSVGGLLGGSSPSTTPSTTPSASPTGSSGNGLTIPPLVGGLLPGIGIGVSGS